MGLPFKNPPSSAGDASSIPGQENKIPHAAEQLSLHCINWVHICGAQAPQPEQGSHTVARAHVPPPGPRERESRSVLSDSLRPHGLYSPWNSPGQNRILERVAFPFSRGSSQPRNWTQVSSIAGGFFTSWACSQINTTHFFLKEPYSGTGHLLPNDVCEGLSQLWGRGDMRVVWKWWFRWSAPPAPWRWLL